MSKTFQIDIRELLGPVKKTRFFTLWDQGLAAMERLDKEHKLNIKLKFLSLLVFHAYEFPEAKIFYWEQESFDPKHPWIREALDGGLINCPEFEFGHFLEPKTYDHDELPSFVKVSQQFYELKKSLEPDSKTIKIYETWPKFTRYTLKITKRAERKMDNLAAAKDIEEILGKQDVKLEDAVSIEVSFGLGKVDVIKLWKWFKS